MQRIPSLHSPGYAEYVSLLTNLSRVRGLRYIALDALCVRLSILWIEAAPDRARQPGSHDEHW